MNMCSFCFSNGESDMQFRGHVLKDAYGRVTCPVLRKYKCPHCGVTGDYAHTQSYCPLNREGKFGARRGASLVELKKKKNAAGNLPNVKKFNLYNPHYIRNPYKLRPGAPKFVPKAAKLDVGDVPDMTKTLSTPEDVSFQAVSDPFPSTIRVTEPLPSSLRPKTPPPALQFGQPESAQLTMYRHYQYLQFYREKESFHKAEIHRLKALRATEKRHIQEALTTASPCFTRSFGGQQQTTGALSLSPGGSPRPESSFSDHANDDVGYDWMMMEASPTFGAQQDSGVCLYKAYSDSDSLTQMLEELRYGTEELDF